MTDFAPAALARIAPLDPTKHVRYTLGMVLGVDDFDQEFAYLSSRDRWLARDLVGSGTIWGLTVTVEEEAAGPRFNVAPGVAVTPCGQLVCVAPAQCAYLNDWLDTHEGEVRALLASSPPSDTLRLYAVLCYRECPTDDVPIPGEPCRTEDTLSAPSRTRDDFRLELRTTRPLQPDDKAVRAVVAWLRRVPVVTIGGSSVGDLLGALRDTVDAATADPGSPPHPLAGVELDLGLPPAGLTIPAADVATHVRAAFALWVTELRPLLRRRLAACEAAEALAGTCECGCDGTAGPPGTPCDDDVVLLASVDLDVVQELDGRLVVASGGWRLDQGDRPYVVHTRFLQEWVLAGGLLPVEGSPPDVPERGSPLSAVTAHEVVGDPTATFDAATGTLDLGIPAGAGIDDVVVTPLPPGTDATVIDFSGSVLDLGIPAGRDGAPGADGATGPRGPQGRPGETLVVAAGRIEGSAVVWQFGDLEVEPTGDPGHFRVIFARYEPDRRYVLKGTPIIQRDDRRLHTVELVEADPKEGLFIRVVADNLDDEPLGFVLEISDYTEVSP